MFSLIKDNVCIFSTQSVENLYSYIKINMDSIELKEADEMWKTENRTEYGAMYHLCLLEHCSKLEGCSLLIHKGEYNGNS